MNPRRIVLACCACLIAAALWPTDALAQRSRVFISAGYASRPVFFGYRPAFYDPFFYDPLAFGWSQWYPYPYPPPPYYYGRRSNIAEARIEVKPSHAQVYLDGYYMGTVDDFDGSWQRLELPSGEHEIVVYLQGYKSYHQRTFFRPGQDYHFKAVLEPLAQGETQEPQPQPSEPPPAGEPREPGYGPPRGGESPRMPPPRPGRIRAEPAEGFGTLSLRVQPADAVVTIDGERWDSPEGGSRLIVQLSAGPHRIEVEKEGLRTYTSTVDIQAGETRTLNVSLPPGGGEPR